MEFIQFHNWVYKELGVKLNSYKETQLNRRIGNLMERIGVNTLEEYKNLLIRDQVSREVFLEYITINVTEFFRNPEFFKNLKNIIEKQGEITGTMKIWSAGCSAGCEAYTLNIILQNLPNVNNYIIQGTDIDDTILKRAKEGYYNEIEIKNVSDDILEKYFYKKDNLYYVTPQLKTNVKFKKSDLLIDEYEKDFDLIVCRNVLIYFKEDAKNEIIKRFTEALKPGGILFVGATESLNSYKEYGLEKLSPFIYMKL